MSRNSASTADLEKEVSERLQITKKDSKKVIRAVLDCLVDLTATKGRVQLNEFGVFSTKTRTARDGVNPRSGEYLHVPEKRQIHFRASQRFKHEVNG